jgi:hypothetical protein
MQADTFYGKFVGTIESPAPGEPGGPPIGQPVPPLVIQSVAVSGNFSMAPSTAPESPPSNFEINLAGSTGTVFLASGSKGLIDNFDIGTIVSGTGTFTDLTVTGNIRFTSSAIDTLIVTGGAVIGRDLVVTGNITSNSTSAIKVPVGTTTQRPAPIKGMIRFNDTDGIFEGYNGADWIPIGGALDEDYGLITGSPDIFIDYGGLF